MNNAQKVRAIYLELRQAIGEEHSDKELLVLSHGIVDSYQKSRESTPNFSLRLGSIPFEQRDLTEAFSDGGWNVMSYETELMSYYHEEHRDHISDNMSIESWLRTHAI